MHSREIPCHMRAAIIQKKIPVPSGESAQMTKQTLMARHQAGVPCGFVPPPSKITDREAYESTGEIGPGANS